MRFDNSCRWKAPCVCRLPTLQPRVYRFTLEGQDGEDTFVNAADGPLADEAFQAFDSRRKFAQCQRAEAFEAPPILAS